MFICLLLYRIEYIYIEVVGIIIVKFIYLEFYVFINGKKFKEWNLVGVSFNWMYFEIGGILKLVKNLKCFVICFVLYFFIFWMKFCLNLFWLII